jgi:thiol:disulfide interchange protein DsbD
MKKISVVLILMLFTFHAVSQILNPVQWGYASKRTSKTEAVVFIKATIADKWHIYSQNIKDGGPVKTTFNFNKSKAYYLIGNTAEPQPINTFDNAFGINVGYFEKSVIFQQTIKLTASRVTVEGTINYMTCNDTRCLPPEDVKFSIQIK